MKKTFFFLFVAALVASVTLASAFASPDDSNPKQEERRAKREARKALAVDQMKAALAQQSFDFSPLSYSLPYGNTVMLNSTYGLNYLDFTPENLDVNLPFELQNNQKFNLDSQLTPYDDYTVKMDKDGMNCTITAELNNVSSNSFNAPLSSQGINLDIHISVNLLTGNAYLTITPDFSPAVTYQGTVRPT